MTEKTLLPGIIYPLNGQGRCEFEEVAVYFSEEEWGCLTGEEKELYKEVMMENYWTLRSLGQIRATPPIISVIEQGKEPCVRGLWPPSETDGPLNIHHTEADGVTTIRQTETAPSPACLSDSSDAARCCAKRRRSPCIDQRKKMKATSSVLQESTSQQLHISRPAEQPRFDKETTLEKVLPEHSTFSARNAHPSVCIKEEPEKDNPAETSSSPAPRAHAEYIPAQIKQEPAEDNPAPAPRTHTKYTSTQIKREPAENPAETSSTPAPRAHAEYTSTQIKQEPAEDNPAPAPRTHTKYTSTQIKREPAENPAETSSTPAPRAHAEYIPAQMKPEPAGNNPAETSSTPAPRAHAEYIPAQIKQEPAEDNPAPAPRTHTKYTSTQIKREPAENPAETSSTPAPRAHAEYIPAQMKPEPAGNNPAETSSTPAPRAHAEYIPAQIKQEPAEDNPAPAPRTHTKYTSTQIKQEPAGNNPAETSSTPAPRAHAEYIPAQIKQVPAGNNPAEASSITPNPSIASTPARHPSTLIPEESAIYEEGKVTNGEVNSSAEQTPREYTSTHIRDLGFFVRILKGFIFAESEASPTRNSDLGMRPNDPERTRLPSECRIVFSSNEKNARHQVVHTKEAFSCSKCKENFQSKSDLETHKEIHRLEEGFRCSDCGKCFDHRSKLAEHLVSQNLASSDCVKKDRPNATHFRKALHIEQQRTSNGDLVTYVSMKTTSDKERNFAGAEGWPPAEQTPATVTSSEKTTENPDSECHEEPHGETSHGYFTRSAGHVIDQDSNKLDKWLSEYEKMSSTPRHIRRQRIHNQKVYPCSKCKKTFEQKSNLLAHEQIHLRETIFKGAALRKPFGFSALSNTGEHGIDGTSASKENCLPVASLGSGVSVGPHQPKNQEVRRLHTSSDGQRRTNGDANKKEKLTCLVCGENFIYNSDLLLHLRAHSGAKPPECSGCGKSFKNYVDLVIHQKTHREGKESPGSGKCSVCHKPSGRSGSW